MKSSFEPRANTSNARANGQGVENRSVKVATRHTAWQRLPRPGQILPTGSVGNDCGCFKCLHRSGKIQTDLAESKQYNFGAAYIYLLRLVRATHLAYVNLQDLEIRMQETVAPWLALPRDLFSGSLKLLSRRGSASKAVCEVGRRCRCLALIVFAVGATWQTAARCDPLDTPASDNAAQPRTARATGIVGHVRLPSGQPLPGILVVAVSLIKPSPPIPDIAIVTDAAGYYVWDLPLGRYQLTFVRNGQRIATRDVAIGDASRTVTLNLTVSARENP